MARQVFFDPFGSYAQGYDTGTQREMQMQDATRKARAQDFSYNYMLPFEYKNAQRQDELAAFGLPYQKNAIQYSDQLGQNNVYNSNQGIAKDFGIQYGITAPYTNTAFQRFNITPHLDQYTTPPAEPPQVTQARQHYLQNLDATTNAGGLPATPELRQRIAEETARYFNVDPRLVMAAAPTQQQAPVPQYTYTMMGPDGNPVTVGRAINPDQNLLDYWNRPAAMDTAKTIYGMDKDAYEAQFRMQQEQQRQDNYNLQNNYYQQKYGGQGQQRPAAVTVYGRQAF